MELRHLRYFVAVAEALNFTKAAAALRVAQPALSRQVQDLEDELGVDLFKRSPRGVTLTAEGKLFLDETREILKRTEESVGKVRALARGEFGTLHIGYAPAPSVEILPPSMAALKKAAPGVSVVLHDLAEDKMIAGLTDGSLELAITVDQTGQPAPGIIFEELMRYPFCLAMAAGHPLAKRKSIPLKEIATHPLVGLSRSGYAEYHRILERMFAPVGVAPQVTTECDGSTSILTELEVGNGVAIVSQLFRVIAGKRLVYRPISGTDESHAIGIARATKGDVTPAGEKFCDILRTTASEIRGKSSKG
ncbi:MAG: LysR family transcriptional regulator [Verrucomicrobiaceae bacterium]|nr:MAG: LysR family transcriptional regulator [Verrucomicrobiaceae bacterium]